MQVFNVACDLLTLLTLFSAELLVVLVVRCVVCFDAADFVRSFILNVVISGVVVECANIVASTEQ